MPCARLSGLLCEYRSTCTPLARKELISMVSGWPVFGFGCTTFTLLVRASAWLLFLGARGVRDSLTPIARMRLAERGIGSGGVQVNVGVRSWACASWAWLIRSARRPLGATKRAAMGRILSKCSTARRVTASAGGLGKLSARPENTSMFVNVICRMISRRKVAFFWLDSIRVRSILGAQILMGRPGKPAPEPMSIKRVRAELCSAWTAEGPCSHAILEGKRLRAAKRDSPKWRVTISSSLWMAVRLMRAFQRINRSMYVDILSRSLVVSRWSSSRWFWADPRQGCNSSAMRCASIASCDCRRQGGNIKSQGARRILRGVCAAAELPHSSQRTA